MRWLFRRDREEDLDDLEDDLEGDPEEDPRERLREPTGQGRGEAAEADDETADALPVGGPLELPHFAVIVAESAIDGWHIAAVVGESGNPEFYVRAVTVRWPFVIARPVPSNRASDKPVRREDLSPTGSTPAQKLVVNWGWEEVEGNVSQLRFFIRRTMPGLFRTGRVTVRLTLKESALPRRRIVVKLRSNAITWSPPEDAMPEDEMPEEPPAPST